MEKSKPIRIPACGHYGISPFGAFCFACNMPIGSFGTGITANLIRKHNERKRHEKNNTLGHTQIAKLLEEAMERQYSNIRNFDAWIVKNNISHFSCSCGFTSNKKYNIQRHIEIQQNKAQNSSNETHIFGNCITCVETTCGRNIEMRILSEMMNKPPVHNVTVNLNPSINISQKIDSGDKNQDNLFVPLKSNNRKWITVTKNEVQRIFNKFKRVDEVLDPYLELLKLLTISCDGCIVKQIERDLEYWVDDESNMNDDDSSNTDNSEVLDFFVKCIVLWIETYCREHVNLLDGQIRYQMHSFFDESASSQNGYNLTFTMREREDVICREIKMMICYIWKLYSAGEIGQVLESQLSPIIEQVRKISTKYDGTVSTPAIEEMICGLVIQKFLYFIFTESSSNAFSLLLGQRIVMTRLFYYHNKTVGSETTRELRMRSCGEFGSVLSLHIHIYRLATASLIACTERVSWENIIENARKSSLLHTLSPLITRVKHMNNNKIEVRTKSINNAGDITVDDFTFPKCIWSRIIRKLIDCFDDVLGEMIAMDNWKLMVDTSNTIYVERIEKTDDPEHKKELMHYNFHVNINGKIVRQSDILFKENISSVTFERLTGIVMICLHGLGLGSARVAELLRILQHQIYWSNGCLYYITMSNKRRSSNISNKKVVTHKLPASISRYLLIYDYIGMKYSSGRDTFLFLGNSEKNQFFYSEIASIFDLPSNCSSLVMRHLWTSICNYLFPGNNNNFDKSIVTTAGSIAEMSGHSAETHERFYSSTIEKETFYNDYHRGLGEDITVDSTIEQPIGFATKADILHCLKVLFGARANFLSDLQFHMIEDACNNQTKHSFCTICCGGGKSLSWVIPPIRESLNSVKPKLSIIILPYCFLLDHHVNSIIRLVGTCSSINVEKLKGIDVYDNLRPNVLRDKNTLPTLLFLSLEAVAKLVDYHFEYLHELQKDGLIHKIYIDECHTLVSELNFRNNYHALGKLAALNIPMMVQSGSFHRSFINSFAKYIFCLENDTNSYKLLMENDLFGSRLVKIEHIASRNYIGECIKQVEDYVQKSFGERNVHIIVSTIDEGRRIYDKLQLSFRNLSAFIYSGSEGQDSIARKWSGNELRILISTTLGLVGNESNNTQLVCIVGMLYNLPSVVQSIGRIRPMRRCNDSSCLIFTNEQNSARLKQAKDESTNAYNELVGCKIISSGEKMKYFRSMTMMSVNSWLFNDMGCRVVSLANRLGYSQGKCNICDICCNNHVGRASISKSLELTRKQKQKERGIRILQRLKDKCIVCNRSSCTGNCIARKVRKGQLVCFHCLGGHVANKCGVVKPILQGKACYSCYVYNYDQSVQHRYTDCSRDGGIKERLRALLQYDYNEKNKQRPAASRVYTFQEHLSGIYASSDTFFEFLNIYYDWK